ncbi:uncharacterized protein SAPINGB_P003766 [Magnusiomyces paraingens]|uniref:5-hydroxyisourate hydrolase n=1 Tax=Magnusiomyces paraingens TaxID=2606893 RepID=A0A5E8BT88_9ASCO|nr:uncharacterized protein SAPINGB_P003766 [Saprochaete ingens]VVT53819.1 unnamed protein product [Saprochaete ingens]
MSKHPITCHILDTASGKPAASVSCTLYLFEGGLSAKADSNVIVLGTASTNSDGRVMNWDLKSDSEATSKWSDSKIVPGIYKIRFETLKYFETKGESTFFPFVEVVFKINNPPDGHYHVPLLLSNFSYSTYRGS